MASSKWRRVWKGRGEFPIPWFARRKRKGVKKMLKLDIQLFAVPFRKVSKTRKRMRRSHNALTMPGMVACKECGEMIKPHRACPKCGSYKGKTVVAKKKNQLKNKII